jgi:hypothetical protein
MKYIKTYEDIKINTDSLIDADNSNIGSKFLNFKKPAHKMSWNQSRPTEEGVLLGKNGKWQVIVKDIKKGGLKNISQHLYQDEAQKAYDDYYKNNKKEEKPKLYKPDKNTNALIGGTIKTDFKNNINIPHENDWVIVEFNPNYKLSKDDQKFADFINNTIGRIKIQKDANTYIVEYKTVPKNIHSYFIYSPSTSSFTRTVSDKDIKHYSYTQKYLKKYLIKTDPINDKSNDIYVVDPNNKYPFTIGKLYDKILEFMSKINDVIPYNENTYYTAKFVGTYITITNVTKNKVKETVGIISVRKDDIFNTRSKTGIGNEKNFKIEFNSYSTDPYINIINKYVMNTINDNNLDTNEIKFHETQYDNIMNNISKLSLEELKYKLKDIKPIEPRKYIKKIAEPKPKKEIKKISTLNEALFNFLKQLTDILPENYTVKNNSNVIHITKLSIANNGGNRKDVTGYFILDKFYNTKKQFIFKIFIRCNPSLNPYINSIVNYIIDNIKTSNTKEEHKYNNKKYDVSEEDYYIYFNENDYEEIIDNINKLSIDELKLNL